MGIIISKVRPFLYLTIIFLLTPYWKWFLWGFMIFLCFINLNYHYADFNTKKSELVDILQKADNVINKVVYILLLSRFIYLYFHQFSIYLSKKSELVYILQKADNVITKVILSKSYLGLSIFSLSIYLLIQRKVSYWISYRKQTMS